jgi:Ca2+-binding EF-hand superfamily protein
MAAATEQEQQLMREVLRVSGEDGFKKFRKASSRFAKGKIGVDEYGAFVMPLFDSDPSLSKMRTVLLGVIRDEGKRAALEVYFSASEGRERRASEAEEEEDAALMARARAKSSSSSTKRQLKGRMSQQQSLAEAMQARLSGGKSKKKGKKKRSSSSGGSTSPTPSPRTAAATPSPPAAAAVVDAVTPLPFERPRRASSNGSSKSHALFEEYDVDGDGFLNATEMIALFAHLNPGTKIPKAQIKEVIAVMATKEGGSRFGLFGDADAVSMADFETWHSKQHHGRSRSRSRSKSGSNAGGSGRKDSASSSGRPRAASSSSSSSAKKKKKKEKEKEKEKAAAPPRVDRELSSAEQAEARALFTELDTDGSGYLEAPELEAIIADRPHSAMEKDAMLREIDTDGDGYVELAEFGCWFFRAKRWGSSEAAAAAAVSGGSRKKSSSTRARARSGSSSRRVAAKKTTSASKAEEEVDEPGAQDLRDLKALLRASGFTLSKGKRAKHLPAGVREALASILQA